MQELAPEPDENKKILAPGPEGPGVLEPILSPDGQRMAAVHGTKSGAKELYVWDTASGEILLQRGKVQEAYGDLRRALELNAVASSS